MGRDVTCPERGVLRVCLQILQYPHCGARAARAQARAVATPTAGGGHGPAGETKCCSGDGRAKLTGGGSDERVEQQKPKQRVQQGTVEWLNPNRGGIIKGIAKSIRHAAATPRRPAPRAPASGGLVASSKLASSKPGRVASRSAQQPC